MRGTDPVRLGRTGPEVTRLGLGASVIGGLFAPVEQAEAEAVVRTALELGLRQVDTAPLYGLGASELVCGKVLASVPRESVVVSTKAGRLLRSGAPDAEKLPEGMWHGREGLQPVFDFSAAGIARSVEESLERLGLDRLDVVYLHDPNDHVDEAIAEGMPALRRLQAEGVVGAVGAGMTRPALLTRIVREAEPDCVLIAGRYSLLDQSAGIELLPACQERGVGVLVGGVFNSGVLARPAPGAHFDYEPASPDVLRRVARLAEACGEHGVPLAAAALQFPLRHPAVASVVVGARSVEELEENVRSFELDLPGELWRDFAERGLIDAEPPVGVLNGR